MDHARAVGGLVSGKLVLALEDADGCARVAAGQFARDGQADDPPADDRQIAARGRRLV